MAGDWQFERLTTHLLADSGALLFKADINSVDAGVFARGGLWLVDAQNLEPLAIEGEPAVGLGPGEFFTDLRPYVISDNGEVGFTSTVTSGALGFWIGTPGNLELIAITGQPAPGADSDEILTHISGIRLNSAGHVLLRGHTGTARGAWLRDRDGEFHRLFFGGDEFVFDDSHVGVIHGPGGGTRLNNNGQVMTTLTFTDDTRGVFMWELVPEPGSGFLVLIGVLALGATRRRESRS